MRFRILLVALMTLTCWQPAYAQHFGAEHFEQQTVLASAARTATTYGPWIKADQWNEHIYCVGDVTVSNTTGTLAFGIQVCDIKAGGAVDNDCTANAVELLTDGTHLAVVTKRFLLTEQTDPAGFTAAFIDTEVNAPIPPYWRVSATHASGNESTYSVDCMWW
jgi:hypothetical protein